MAWEVQAQASQWLVLAGWSALIVCWHSSILALLFAAWRAVRPEAPPRRHYALAIVAVATALALAVLTPALLVGFASRPAAQPAVDAGSSGLPVAAFPHEAQPLPLRAVDSALVSAPAVRAGAWWVGLLWIAGCAALVLRLIAGLAAVRWIRRRATPAESAAVVDAVAATCAAWHLPPTKVLASSSIDAPVTLGVRHPVVIVPREAEARLPADALASLVAHELAHVARRDYAVNLAQSLADAVLFFSPGARWISRCAREAREYCCDDLAVDRCGGPATYARALMLLAGLRVAPHAHLALGATGPRLVVRIRRLLREDSMARHPRRYVAVVVALLAVAALGGRGLVSASVAGVAPVVQAAPAVQPPAAIVAAPARVADLPAFVSMVPIPYPEDARLAGVQGPVVLSVTSDVNGQPSDVSAVAGEAVLASAAIDAVRQWRFAAADAPQTFLMGVTVMPRDTPPGTSSRPSIKVRGVVKPPTKIVSVNPTYPEEARKARVQGIVILEARIGADGIVDAARILRSVPELDAAALTAVVQWQYMPTLLNGAGVPVDMTVTMNFALQ